MSEMTSRRSVLTSGIAAAAVLSAAPAVAMEAEDPMLPFYREWLDARREFKRLNDAGAHLSDPATAAVTKRELAAEHAIGGLTPTSMAGLAALAHVLWGRIAWEYPEDEYEEDTTTRLLLSVWRAGGKSGLPPDLSEV